MLQVTSRYLEYLPRIVCKMAKQIPVVDFSKCSLDQEGVCDEDFHSVGKLIFEAFSSVGFVYLTNTGVNRNEIEVVEDAMKKFFELELAKKLEFARNERYHGYVRLFEESANPQRPGDYKEAYNVNSSGLTNPNTLWPDEYVPGFTEAVKEFLTTCKKLSLRLLQALTFGLEVKDKSFLLKTHSRMNDIKNYTTLRSLYYPPIQDDSALKPGQIRLGEHCDYGSFTLLFQDNVGGLQIEGYDGKYIEAVPIPDTVLINIGDALQFWTKGRLKSTRHRIVIPEDEKKRRSHRRSIVYFVHPNDEVMMSEMEYEASALHCHKPMKSEYDEPVTALQHVERRLTNSYK